MSVSTLTELTLDDFLVLRSDLFRLGGTAFIVCPGKENKGTNSRAQRTHTTHQQCKNVEQAFGCSGNQCFLGHRSVPRIGLFAPDDSTNGGRAMNRRMARLAGAIIPAFDWEELHAVGY